MPFNRNIQSTSTSTSSARIKDIHKITTVPIGGREGINQSDPASSNEKSSTRAYLPFAPKHFCSAILQTGPWWSIFVSSSPAPRFDSSLSSFENPGASLRPHTSGVPDSHAPMVCDGLAHLRCGVSWELMPRVTTGPTVEELSSSPEMCFRCHRFDSTKRGQVYVALMNLSSIFFSTFHVTYQNIGHHPSRWWMTVSHWR